MSITLLTPKSPICIAFRQDHRRNEERHIEIRELKLNSKIELYYDVPDSRVR